MVPISRSYWAQLVPCLMQKYKWAVSRLSKFSSSSWAAWVNTFFPVFFTHYILKLGHTQFCLELFLVCFTRESQVRTFGCKVNLKSLVITVGAIFPQNPFHWWCWLKGCHLYVSFTVSLLYFPKLHNLKQQLVWNNPNPGVFSVSLSSLISGGFLR